MNADELLRMALEELEVHGDRSTWFLIQEIRTYLAAPKKPMTEEEVEAATVKLSWEAADGFCAGVEFAERYHGITGENE